MKTRLHIALCFALATCVACGPFSSTVSADIRLPYGSILDFPDVHPGPPIYWRPIPEVLFGEVPGDQEWVAQIFYRPPVCAGDFNLLNFFDVPYAWFCPLLMEGFGIFTDPMGTPRQSVMMGDAVPIWFVAKDEYEDAIADGELNLLELLNMPSLRTGVADFYLEMLQPLGGPARKPKLEIYASGKLDDGGTFDVISIEGAKTVNHLEITLTSD